MEIKAGKIREEGFYTQPFSLAAKETTSRGTRRLSFSGRICSFA